MAIKIAEGPGRENFLVMGRGEFQLAIIIETMRREGYEFCVGRPRVLFKENLVPRQLHPRSLCPIAVGPPLFFYARIRHSGSAGPNTSLPSFRNSTSSRFHTRR